MLTNVQNIERIQNELGQYLEFTDNFDSQSSFKNADYLKISNSNKTDIYEPILTKFNMHIELQRF